MNKTLLKLALTVTLAGFALAAQAEDIEIYMEPGSERGSEPLVMFNIDYRPDLGRQHNAGAAARDFFVAHLGNDPNIPAEGAAWSYFDTLRLALKVVFLDLQGVQIGLMLPHNRFNNCAGPDNVGPSCANGGYIAMGFQSVDKFDSNGQKARFNSILSAIPQPGGGNSHSWQTSEIWFEFFRYLTGQGVYNGRNGHRSYPDGDGFSTDKNLDENFPAFAWDASVMQQQADGSWTYISPLVDETTECTRIFTISFIMGTQNQDADSNSEISKSIANGGLGLPHRNNTYGTQVLEFLYGADLGNGNFGVVPEISGQQNVIGYFLTDSPVPNARHAYAQAMGTNNTLGVLDDPELLVETLNNIFEQILSVSTTFVAASVPVNVFNRSEIVDNVYIALFQADPEAKPYWPGSLKKLKIEEDAGVVRLVDALGNDAVAADGRVNFNALTFWTDADALPPPSNETEIVGRDGRSVDRGGAGQQIPGFISGGPGFVNGIGNRNLFTEPGSFINGNKNTMMALNANDATADTLRPHIDKIRLPDETLVNAVDAPIAEVVKKVAWMRGMDVDNDAGLPAGAEEPEEARPWILGDPLHSRPLPINYGARGGHSNTNPDIRILMGSNDGYMRMFRNTDTAGGDLGVEVWGFMPREAMKSMHKLRDNAPIEGLSPHPYTVDGAPVVYTEDIAGDGTLDGSDRVLLFFGMRRGGASYYALDISDPDDPKLLWRITPADLGFEQLGMTFSTPQVGRKRIKVGEDGDGNPINETIPVIVFGGGYDFNKDARGGVGTTDAQGNAIFVVNANDGTLVWKAVRGGGAPTETVFQHPDMLDSIPSDPTAIDTSGDGFIDRIYVGDTGGTVWRADLGSPDRSTWTASVIAFVGRHFDGSTMQHDRRFFHAPDVVLSRDDIGPFDAVIIGSGNRANPLDRGQDPTTENFFYMIKDRRTESGPVPIGHVAFDHESFGDVTDNCLQAGDCAVNPNLTNGWRLQLEEVDGEKSLAVPFTVAGTIFFTTYLPPGRDEPVEGEDGEVAVEAATCGPAEGGGVLYAVALADARSVINFDVTDDDPDHPGEATTRSDRTRALRSGGIPAEVVSLPPNRILLPDLSTETIPGSMRWRTFWYENEGPDA